jgi:hypothetical protein
LRKLLPALVSITLIGWLIWRVSLAKLLEALSVLPVASLVTATALLVLALFLWDSYCIAWLFRRPQRPLTYGAALRGRGSSYLFSAVNYELGQGVLAYQLAGSQRISFLEALGRCVLLGYHDLIVLLGFGLLGALLGGAAGPVRGFCAGGLALLGALPLLVRLLPVSQRTRLAESRGGVGLQNWSTRRSAQLLVLRAGYYALFLAYAAVALDICALPASFHVVCGAIPLVLLADGLPISVSGLGTRETALLYLLSPAEPGTLLALSLVWSSGLMFGRLAIGVIYLALPAAKATDSDKPEQRKEAA